MDRLSEERAISWVLGGVLERVEVEALVILDGELNVEVEVDVEVVWELELKFNILTPTQFLLVGGT